MQRGNSAEQMQRDNSAEQMHRGNNAEQMQRGNSSEQMQRGNSAEKSWHRDTETPTCNSNAVLQSVVIEDIVTNLLEELGEPVPMTEDESEDKSDEKTGEVKKVEATPATPPAAATPKRSNPFSLANRKVVPDGEDLPPTAKQSQTNRNVGAPGPQQQARKSPWQQPKVVKNNNAFSLPNMMQDDGPGQGPGSHMGMMGGPPGMMMGGGDGFGPGGPPMMNVGPGGPMNQFGGSPMRGRGGGFRGRGRGGSPFFRPPGGGGGGNFRGNFRGNHRGNW